MTRKFSGILLSKASVGALGLLLNVRGMTVHIEKQGFKSFDEARAFKAKEYDNEMENRVTVHKRYTVDDYWRIYADNKFKSGAGRSSTAYAREQGYKAYLKDYWGKVLLKIG